MTKLYTSKQWLYKKYVVEKIPVDDIAKMCGAGRITIYRWLKIHGLLK
jgi:transposase